MGRLKLYIGPHGSYYYFKNQIIDLLSNDEGESFIYLLPVNRAVRYLKKDLVRHSSTHNHLDPAIFTFRSLIQFLYRNVRYRKRIITQPMRLMLLENIFRTEAGNLRYFPSGSGLDKGLVLKADQMVEEFYQFGYKAGHFTEPPPSAVNKYHDFGFLLSELDNIYSDQLVDESSLAGGIISHLDQDLFRRVFPRVDKVYISGFGIYSPPMLKIINFIKDLCDIQIKVEYDSENMELFKHTHDVFEALSHLSDEIVEDRETIDGMSRTLFKTDPRKNPKLKSNTPIFVKCAENRKHEVRYIVSRIKNLHLKKNVPLRKIGITFPDLESYTPLLKKEFKEAGIPYNLSTGLVLVESPLIQAFMQVLRVVQSGFRSSEIYKLALSPFLNNRLEKEAEFLRLFSQKYRLNYLTGEWDKHILKLISSLEKNDLTPRWIKDLGLDNVPVLLSNLKTILNKIRRLDSKYSAEDFHKIYTGILTDLGLMVWYNEKNPYLKIAEEEKEFRAFNRFIKLFEQMIWVLKTIHHDQKLTSTDFLKYLSLTMENATYNLREWSDFGVQIMPRLEILSLDLQTLFIGGLVEGNFPRQFTRDIFFSDEERSLMGLNASEDLLGQDRFLFHQLLTSGADEIILTHPLQKDENKLLRSTFISMLEECVTNIQPDDEDESANLSIYSMFEQLGKSLKKGISQQDLEIYGTWSAAYHKSVRENWQEGVNDLLRKKSHREITSHEGNLSGAKTAIEILSNQHIKRSFSVTALESYAFCPMQYYLQRILNIEEEEDLEPVLSSLERGNAIHYILYLFYSKLEPEARREPWKYADLLNDIAWQVLSSYPYNDLLWTLEIEKNFGTKDNPGLWQIFLKAEKKHISKSGFSPYLFEFNFGGTPKSATKNLKTHSFSIDRREKSIRLRGKIDRIDLKEDGHFIVIDYKTGQGSIRTKVRDLLEGKSLQLPVYMLAAQEILTDRKINAIPAGGIYYLVQDRNICFQKALIADKEFQSELEGSRDSFLPNPKCIRNNQELLLHQVIQDTTEHILNYIDQIAGGNFQHTDNPESDKCSSYCNYRRICRKDVSKLLTINVPV